ncbi:uncharacterized protein LOC141619337 [Silene latifolia]|uniref:uncharacterized protein LOC141619337 n=1 Tax=Silene latifolia TaxID=37657 RepID=UPI003D77A293
MVWNIQGTGSKNKIKALKEVISIYKPTIIALVEMHMDDTNADKIRRVIGYDGHSRVDANGFSEGICIYWKPEIVTVNIVTEHQQFITIKMSRNRSFPWLFSAVYASPDPTNRKELSVELETLVRQNDKPWLLAGDFDKTRNLNERHGGNSSMARRCAVFNNWIENCDLIELAFTGSAHTWARGNNVETRQSARLDRALCNTDWGSMFEEAMVKHLPTYQSDHCPLSISPNGFAPLASVQKPFKFQATWMTHENFSEYVQENWPVVGDFPNRLKVLSEKLQDWNKKEFGNIFRQKIILLARIEGCQRELSIARNGGLIKLEAKLRKVLDEVLEREELLWYQKSRVDFIVDGD